MVIDLSAVLFLLQQFTFRKYGQVLGHCWPRGVEVGCDGAGCHSMRGYQYQYGPPRGVCYGLKYISP